MVGRKEFDDQRSGPAEEQIGQRRPMHCHDDAGGSEGLDLGSVIIGPGRKPFEVPLCQCWLQLLLVFQAPQARAPSANEKAPVRGPRGLELMMSAQDFAEFVSLGAGDRQPFPGFGVAREPQRRGADNAFGFVQLKDVQVLVSGAEGVERVTHEGRKIRSRDDMHRAHVSPPAAQEGQQGNDVIGEQMVKVAVAGEDEKGPRRRLPLLQKPGLGSVPVRGTGI